MKYSTTRIPVAAVIMSSYPGSDYGYELDGKRHVRFLFDLPDDEVVRSVIREAETGNPVVRVREYDKAVLKIRGIIAATRE